MTAPSPCARMTRARLKWTLVQALEAEDHALDAIVRTVRAELMWAQAGDRLELKYRLDSAMATSALTKAALALARDEALVASDKAADATWGVRLGRRYLLQAAHLEPSLPVLVTSLRPAEGEPRPAMLCTLSQGEMQQLVVLGRDKITLTPIDSTVISLAPRLAARHKASPF